MKSGDPIYDSYVNDVAFKEDVDNEDIEWVNGVPYDTSRFNKETEQRLLSNGERGATPIPDDVYAHVSRQLGIKI